MSLVVYLEPSSEANPGHMVVGQEEAADSREYFGFRVDPLDLPESIGTFRPIWRYLATNSVRGVIFEETRYVEQLLADEEKEYGEKRTEYSGDIEHALPPRDTWENHARYSFNPDDFHSPATPCYNCVTWATSIANRLVAGFLPVVRQGRIGLMYAYLNPLSSGRVEMD